jgi:hypothetical protein
MDDEKKGFEFKFTMAWHNDRLNDEYDELNEQDRINKKKSRTDNPDR